MGIPNVLRFVISLVILTIYLSVLCFFGDEVNTQFENIQNWIYYCNWLNYPFKVQRLIPTMLIVAGKPIYIQGFMNVRCTRESVRKVVFNFRF